MPAGRITRAYAFEVAPKQMTPFLGGRLNVTQAVQDALDATFDLSGIATAPAVTFEIDTTTTARAHPIRDAVQTICFGSGPAPLNRALGLAQRLADSMDHRSKPTLLMVTVHEGSTPTRARALLWTFPREDVFRLGTASGQTKLDLLTAFNRESRLRKAAMLEGGQANSQMLMAKVLDFQASATDREVADLWTIKFLESRMQMGSVEGTSILAKTLRHAHDRFKGDVDAQAQIHVAIGALQTGPKRRESIEQIAARYFSGEVRNVVLSGVRPEERQPIFDIDRDLFDKIVQYRIFELENGVLVSAPFGEVGTDSVQITERNGERTLRAQGVIESEKVRARAT